VLMLSSFFFRVAEHEISFDFSQYVKVSDRYTDQVLLVIDHNSQDSNVVDDDYRINN
jgi:hypothetical protein